MAISTDQFRDHLIASGLLTVEDVSSMLASLPADKQPQDGEQLARELVRQKKLTKYQAEQIYLGKGKSLVLGNYTILDKLGQGGMGMVLKAEHKRLKRLVALKVLSPAALKTPDALKRFHREVEAAAKLRHTNVVATDDADEAKGTHFLVMEYVEGSDLSALVKKKGPLSVGQALQCILQAARGLEYAHEQGVVHRDIKPANLLLDSKGTVKILDMGLARIEGDSGGQAELTSTGAVMGTVDYMAPEQALSTKTADARSDIYSLGISLWYLLTGKCAYDGDTLMAKLLAHRDAPIPSLTAVRNEVSASIDAVFQKMVAKQSKDRYQSMTEVIRDLEACQSGASFISSLSASAVDDDANPLSLLNNLSGPATSVTNTRQAQPTTTRQVQPTATYVAADPAAEATMLTGDMAQATDPQTMTSARASSSPKKWSRSKAVASLPWWQDRRVQIGGGAAAVLLLLAVVFLFQTPNGTLRVEILDPEVEMRVKGTELTFQGSDLEPVSLKAGEKKLLVTRGDLSFETEAFTLKKGTETRVKVELQGDKLVVNGGGKVIAEQPIQRKGLTTSTTGSDPAFSQWLKDVQAMPAEKQLEAVSKKLVELNPGFDGKLFHHVDGGQGQGVPKIEKGLVTELHFYTDKVTDLSPVRAFSGLKTLSAFPANFASELTDLSPLQGMQLTDLLLAYNSKLSDISPLKGMRLTKLGVRGCAVTDLAPLKGMRLATLDCDGMKTTDLSPLQGMPLQTLDINHTLATDFTPLKGMPLDALYASFTKMGDLSVLHKMPLTTLEISGCPNISDLSPLKELPLKHLGVDFKPDRNADILRSIKTLESINGKSAAEFWKEVEEQQKGKPGITPDGPAPPPAIAPFDAAQAKAHQEAWARYLGVPVEFTNSLGMKFKLIPPGEFAMGFDPALKAELERLKMLDYDSERNKKTRYDHLDAATPRHLVTIPQPYYIGVEEVRVGWYRDVMGSLPPDNPADKPDESVTRNVGQREAIEFCNRLSEREKRPPSFVVTGHTTKLVAEAGGYRLPTEAEWEFACRAGTDTFYFFGNDRGEKGTTGASILSQYQRGRSGAQTRSNPFGLFDVYGGSNEWCWGPVVLSKTNSLCPEPYAASSTMKIDIPAAVDKGAFGVSRGGATSEGAGVDARTVNSYSRRAANRLTVDKWGGVGRLVLPILAPRSVKPTAVQPAPNTAPAAVAPPFAKSPFDVAQAKAHQAAWAKHLGTEVVKPNSIGMQMTLIPPGEFLMGSTDEQVEETLRLNAKAFQTIRDKIQKAERPQHRVIITKPFLIGTTEVTVGQFKQFVAATNYVTEAEKFGFGDSSDNVMSSGISDAQKQRNWRNLNYSYPVTDDFPVSQITWNDAVAFCQWLSEHEKATYRLPTEAEWEYACRAGTTTQFFFGDDEKQLTNYGNVGTSRLTAVSAKSPNPFGLYDTLGNVMEWCSDFHSDDWYSKSPAIDPAGPSSGTHRAIRGGGMAWGSPKCRSATRDGYIPTHRTAPVGFRVVGEVREGIATVKTVTPAERPTVGSQPAPAVAPFDAKQARAHQEVWAKHLGTQIETTNSVGQKMILIPPGEFLMGSSDADIALALKIAEETELDKGGVNRLQEERPQHRVRITKPFRLAAYEVTIGQFAKFIEQAKYKTQAEEFGGNSAAITSEDVKPYSLKLNWRAPGEAVTDDSPVTQVSWNDAVAFCNWLSGQEQLTPCYQRDGDTWTLQPKANGYRLPTEAEWEYSCRAGTATQFSFGDDWKELDKYGWSNKNSGGRPHSVGLLPANAFGLHDMHGNVWEWCHDWYDGKWYEKSPSDDPLGPSRASYRVGRGGSWYGLPAGSRRSSSRGNHRSTPSDRHGDRGFRPVLGSVGAQSGTTSVTASSQPVPSNSSSDRNTPKFTNTLGM